MYLALIPIFLLVGLRGNNIFRGTGGKDLQLAESDIAITARIRVFDFNTKELRRLPDEDFVLVLNDLNPMLQDEISSNLQKLIQKRLNDLSVNCLGIFFLPEMTNRFYDFVCIDEEF